MDWEYYIDNDLSNSLKKSDNILNFLNKLENEIWHPKNCYINMKTNTRIFYTIVVGTLGVTAIKSLYFYLFNKNELEMNLDDFAIIGGLSGLFLGQISLSGIYSFYGFLFGAFYGVFYSSAVRFFVNRQKRRAENIGIIL